MRTAPNNTRRGKQQSVSDELDNVWRYDRAAPALIVAIGRCHNAFVFLIFVGAYTTNGI